jgi:hypothetical protein
MVIPPIQCKRDQGQCDHDITHILFYLISVVKELIVENEKDDSDQYGRLIFDKPLQQTPEEPQG